MPQEIEQEAIEKILDILNRNNVKKPKYLELLRESQETYYFRTELVEKIINLRLRAEDRNKLISLTSYFISIANPIGKGYSQPRF